MAIQKETELYAPLKNYLEQLGYEVKGEVRGCDLVAMRQGAKDPLIIELKKNFNLPLVLQGIDRLSLSNQVYLAVEQPQKGKRSRKHDWNDIVKLCKMLGLGLITVAYYSNRKPHVTVYCEPMAYTPAHSKRKANGLLNEFHERTGDYNIGGSTRRKLMTAYREQALYCAYVLRQHDCLSPKQLREMTGSTKITGILQQNYYGWFNRIGRGKYQLTLAGAEAVEAQKHIIEARLHAD